MSINWTNLRPWAGSQHSAFEELCCQLAACEQVPPKSHFVRKAPPDAGVECFWILPTGEEWAWQAKFFLSPPGPGQWQQLDYSVDKALEKHPAMARYTVCLPLDRQDPRHEMEAWFMNKWNQRVAAWTERAKRAGRSVEFVYWGEHEIWERLSKEEHRGRSLFWFSEALLSKAWFESQTSAAIANAGPRYTPDLNVELPIVETFDGLARSPEFYTKIRSLRARIIRLFAKAASAQTTKAAPAASEPLKGAVASLVSDLRGAEATVEKRIDWAAIGSTADKASSCAAQCFQALTEAANQAKQRAAAEKPGPSSPLQEFDYERHNLRLLEEHLSTLTQVTRSVAAGASNVAALLLVGEAGTGKTHLFCDLAKRRLQADLPTVLLHGAHFRDEEPWAQITQMLGLSCRPAELLGMLEAAAMARGQRALVLVDALNEGDGRFLWCKHLAGMLTALSRHPWISVALSVRSSYETAVVPKGLVPGQLVRTIHRGFAGHEYDATRTFFEHYGIERPTIPLLVPEFRRPLFLKLFCVGLRNRGFTRIPAGIQGITAIFDFFLESVNERLSRAESLDFDPRERPVHRAITRLTTLMADRDQRWLERAEALSVVAAIHPSAGYDRSLFKHLIAEGVLAEDRYENASGAMVDVVHLGYERLADHLVVRYLLDNHFDVADPAGSFDAKRPLGRLLTDEPVCYRNMGLIEALSIQLPERSRLELPDLVPAVAASHPMREAFVEGLPWRHPDAITDRTFAYINAHVVRHQKSHDAFIESLLTLAAQPAHPLNADLLHRHLMKFDLPSRDSWWSILLHEQYGERGAVDRHVEWAESVQGQQHLEEEVARLAGMTLAWFLTSSNRYLRDRATKALVNLFGSRIQVLRKMLAKFRDVNDPYVLERLLAVASGCAMRSVDTAAVRDLAEDVYRWVFEQGKPPIHILARDYARGVTEVAIRQNVNAAIDAQRCRPPHRSEWPERIATNEELKWLREAPKDMPDEEWSRVHLYESVMGFEDFARYIIGTNLNHSDWCSLRLGQPIPPSPDEIKEQFADSLTPRQAKLWQAYLRAQSELGVQEYRHALGLGSATQEAEGGPQIRTPVTHLRRNARRCRMTLVGTLGKHKAEIFRKYIRPLTEKPWVPVTEYRFDLSIIQRLVLSRVLDLGWTVERFGRFDRRLSHHWNHGRSASKPERIGKKYQWIAYHETLARLSDNFPLYGHTYPRRIQSYEGPWQVSFTRDIDPSCLLKRTCRQGWEQQCTAWWSPASYDSWNSPPDDVKWLKLPDDLPAVESLLVVTNPIDGSRWYVLEEFIRWAQPRPEEDEDASRRDLWYMTKSYIVKSADMERVFEWAKAQDFMGRWMPEGHHTSGVFLGEFFWAPAFAYHNVPYFHHDGWTRGYDERIPAEILVSTDEYFWERGGYDCSIEDSLSILLPYKWLADKLGLTWRGVDGSFFDADGALIAFDPSVNTPGPGALLIRYDVLNRFLHEEGYGLLWTFLGEKNIIGGHPSPEEWKGRLELTGAYRVATHGIEGGFRASFTSR